MVKGQRSRDYPRRPGPPSPRPATGARSVAAERVQVGARTMREYGAIRLSATGRSAAAACSGSRHRPASRGQVILDDLAHHHLARVAFPSGPRPRWCGRSPARHRCRPPPGCGRPEHTPGRTPPPGGAGGQAGARYSQRRMADCWPGSWRQGCGRTRGRAVSGYLLAVTRTREAGRRSGPDTVRARGGPAGEDGAPGDVLLRAGVIPVDTTTTDVPDSEKRRVRAVPLISHGTRRSAGPVGGGGRVRDRQRVRISSGGSRHA